MSGGQRQRVAVSRAIVVEPKLFLMDEPLSNLDAKLRVTMRTELKRIHTQQGSTSIFVTHDQSEAMSMADRIVVMYKGKIEHVAIRTAPLALLRNLSALRLPTFLTLPLLKKERNSTQRERDSAIKYQHPCISLLQAMWAKK